MNFAQLKHRATPVIGHTVPGIVGLAVGIAVLNTLGLGVSALILGIFGTVLALSNIAAKAVHDGFDKQLDRLEELTPERQNGIVGYLEELRVDVNAAWMLANLSAGVCAVATSAVFLPTVSGATTVEAKVAFQVIGFSAVCLTAFPFLRILRYWTQMHRFGLEVAEIANRKTRKAEMLEAIRVASEASRTHMMAR